MGFIGSMFSNDKGSGWQAQNAPSLPLTNSGQITDTYNTSQNAIKAQQDFLNALNAQNGIQNQSNVFNQLQGVANGTGPNPAQAMLNQTTGQNVANTAALMASARGANQNPGLIARQAALAGGNLQQQAVGQGATMEANQRLGALGQLAGVAGQQVGQQAGAVQGLNTAAQGEQGQVLGAGAAQNTNDTNMKANQNSTNSDIAKGNQAGQQKVLGGIMNGIGSLFADGGAVPAAAPAISITPISKIGQYLGGGQPSAGGSSSTPDPMYSGSSSMTTGLAKGLSSIFSGGGGASGGAGATAGLSSSVGPEMLMMAAKGGKVPAVVSPGERYIPPAQAKQVARGEKKATEVGQVIPGKAKVSGDSYANDTVKKNLSPGGVVVPRSKNTGDDVAEKATAFVQAILAHRGIPKRGANS